MYFLLGSKCQRLLCTSHNKFYLILNIYSSLLFIHLSWLKYPPCWTGRPCILSSVAALISKSSLSVSLGFMCNHSSNNIHIQTPGSIFLLIHINSRRQADRRLKVVLGPGAIAHCVSLKPSADAVCARRSERSDGLLVYKSVSCMRQRRISGRALLSGSFSLETRGEKWPERGDESPSPPLGSSDTKREEKKIKKHSLWRQNTAHTNQESEK